MASTEEQMVADLQLDIEELQEITKTAKRKNVKILLDAWVEKLIKEKKSMDAIIATKVPQKIETPAKDLT